ncbi:MAG: glycine hydroxymethyltransferase [Chlamydiales bacterium]|nr:glycine hydroxymethyltransferase [Chlamydiales bacterium]
MTPSNFLDHYLKNTKEHDRTKAAIAYLAALDHIESSSPLISHQIIQELKDQRSYLKLIASENFSSLAVQLAMGNLLTDKYAEGYTHHRFYAGCANVDAIEDEAISQVKTLFNCEHAYVQPHSGADANLIAFWAILIERIQNKEIKKLSKKNLDELTPEEYEQIRQLLINQKLMGMSLNSGGHLTHGYKHNISSKFMQAISYEVDPKTELLDYAAIKKQALQEKPLILLAGYSAYPRKINFAIMREIADAAGAVLMADMAHFAGLVAGKAFTHEFDPIPHAHIITSTTHKTLRGPRGGIVLSNHEFSETINKGCPLVMGGPLPHVLAAKAIAFKEANQESYRYYTKKVLSNAATLAESLMEQGIRITTNGTENHLLIADLSSFNLTGRQAESVLREAHLTLNRNAIPFDPNGPWYTSGIRIGSPAMTTLGMGHDEMKEIASIIAFVLKNTKAAIHNGVVSQAKYTTSSEAINKAKTRVQDLLTRFPVYPEIQLC